MIQVPTQIQKMLDDNALFVINHSGGKDSQAMYLLLRDLVPASQICVIHADLGEVEWAGLKEHIKATTDGLPLHVAIPVNRAGEVKTLLGEIERKHAKNVADGKKQAPWPSASQRWCTSDFKRGPLEKVIRRIMKEGGFTKAVNCLGIRALESGARKQGLDKKHYEATGEALTIGPNPSLSKAGRTVIEWRPIFHLTKAEVFQVIAKSGQQPHEMYSKGMSRLSCCFCVLANKNDLTIAAKHAPELYKKYVDLERKTGYTMRSNASLEEVTGITRTEKG